MKILYHKLKDKEEKNAKQKLENDLTDHLTSQEKQKLEDINKSQNHFRKLTKVFLGSTIALALVNGFYITDNHLFDFSQPFTNYFNSIINSSVEYVFINTDFAILSFASIVIPFALSYKFVSKADMNNILIEGYELKNNLRKEGTKKDLQDIKDTSFFSKVKSKNAKKSAENLEWLNEKLTEEEINQLERQIHTKNMKRYKAITYALAGTSIVLTAIFGHQVIDGAFLDITQPLGENIQNFLNTGSIYESGLSFKDNLYYMFYSAIENFEMHKLPLIANYISCMVSAGLFLNYKNQYVAEKNILEEEKKHKENIFNAFLDKMRARKNNLVEQSPCTPVDEKEEGKSKLT